MNKRVMLVLLLVAVLAIMTGCNYTMFDSTWSFNHAQIAMPDGGFIEGRVESWTDFEDSDQLQLKIDGVVYLTHATNVVMMSGVPE